MMFTVVELPPGQEKVTKLDPSKIKGTSVFKEHKEVSVRIKLGPGSFVIVPSTEKPGQYGPYHLSIYVNKPLAALHFQRLDKPEGPLNDYSIIAEESENTEGIHRWKVDLCNKRYAAMITETDFAVTDEIMNSFKAADAENEFSEESFPEDEEENPFEEP